MPYIKPHAHQALEIVYYTDGRGFSTVAGVRHPVARNILTITKAGSYHDQENSVPVTSLCLGMVKSGLEPFQGAWQDETGLLRRPLERLLEEMERRETGRRLVVRGLLLEICGLARRLASQKKPEGSQVQKALSLIREREGRVSLKDLSDALYLSKDYLRHLFQRETKMSPIKHILAARMEKAKDLLSRPGVPVKEAAAGVGIDDIYYFSRLFKKVTGSTPARFRDAMTGKCK